MTYAAIADRLNGMGFTTRREKAFLAMSVLRLDGQRPTSSIEPAIE